jgi:predicted nuclease with TOPRIM domain
MHKNSIESKNNAFKLSTQVKTLLHEKGLSKVFNYSDYKYFKEECKNAWNKAQAIAEKFIEDNNQLNSDFDEYVF